MSERTEGGTGIVLVLMLLLIIMIKIIKAEANAERFGGSENRDPCKNGGSDVVDKILFTRDNSECFREQAEITEIV